MIQAKTAKWFNYDYLIVIIICIIPLPYLFSDYVAFTYVDMYGYVKRALDFENGKMNWFHNRSGGRSNLFPLLLYLSFYVFGKSLLAIKYLYFSLLVIVLLESWLLGKILFKNNSGLIVAIFIGTSFVHVHFLYFPHIDLPLLVLMNLCLIVLYVSLNKETQSKRWFFLSGILIGLTFLFKQTVILFLFIIPVYALLTKEYKNKVIFRNWIIQIIGSTIILIPVIMINISTVLSLAQRFGDSTVGKPHVLSGIIPHFFHPVFAHLKSRGLVLFDQIMIFTGLILLVVAKFENKKAKQFLFATLIVYIPWILWVASKGNNYRQLLFPTFILFFMLGSVIYLLLEKIKSKVNEKYRFSNFNIVIIVLLATVYFARLFLLSNEISYQVETRLGRRLETTDTFATITKNFFKARINTRKANESAGKKDYDTAVQQLSKAITIGLLPPFAVRTYFNRGKAYGALGQYKRAIEDYDKVISLTPKMYSAYRFRGNNYKLLKQYEKAIEDYDQAINLSPKRFDTYILRGRAYKELGKNELAERDFKHAQKLRKNK